MTREKLIKEYESKINDCDILIKDATEKIRSIRKDGPNSHYCSSDEWANDRKNTSSKRQIYCQFIKDLESLD